MKIWIDWENREALSEQQYKVMFELEKKRLSNLECVHDSWLESAEGCVCGNYDAWLTEYAKKHSMLNTFEEIEIQGLTTSAPYVIIEPQKGDRNYGNYEGSRFTDECKFNSWSILSVK